MFFVLIYTISCSNVKTHKDVSFIYLYIDLDLYLYRCMLCCAQLLQSSLALCNPMDCGPPRSSVCGILQARILEWVAVLEDPPGDLPNPGIEPASLMFPALAGRFFTTRAAWEALLSLCSICRFQGKTLGSQKNRPSWMTVPPRLYLLDGAAS